MGTYVRNYVQHHAATLGSVKAATSRPPFSSHRQQFRDAGDTRNRISTGRLNDCAGDGDF